MLLPKTLHATRVKYKEAGMTTYGLPMEVISGTHLKQGIMDFPHSTQFSQSMITQDVVNSLTEWLPTTIGFKGN